MIKIINFIFRLIPGQTWRGGIKGILTSTFTFYLMNLIDCNFIDKYLSLLVNDSLGKFILLYLIVYIFFYWGIDLLLRIMAFKLIHNKILAAIEKESLNSKREILKGISIIKNSAMNFLLGYTVGLGYVTKSELKQIGNIDPVQVTSEEKERAINEIITALNKWACVLIHLLVSLALVWSYNKILVAVIFVLGFGFTVLLYLAIMLFIQNVEVIVAVLRKEARRLK